MKNLLATLTLCLGLGASAHAQMTEQQTRDFPIAPQGGRGLTASKNFAYVGDYLYTSTNHGRPTKNVYLTGLSYADYDYFYFSGTRGKRLFLSVTYNGTTPTTAGGCEHTHLNYGAKGFYTVQYAGYTYTGWSWIGGGTQSGTWNSANRTCNRSVTSNIAKTLPIFGWGQNSLDIFGSSFANGTARYIDAVMFVVMAPTHGVGDCNLVTNPATGISFKACLDDAYLYAWTTNL